MIFNEKVTAEYKDIWSKNMKIAYQMFTPSSKNIIKLPSLHASFSFLCFYSMIFPTVQCGSKHMQECACFTVLKLKRCLNFLFHTVYCAWKHSVRVQYVLLQKPSLAFHILRKIQYIKDNVILCEYWQVHGKIDDSHSVLSFPDDNVLVSSNVAQLVAVKIHHEFAQAGLSGSEVDFDFGLLPGFDGWLQSETNKYLHIRHHTDLILFIFLV